MSLQPSSDRILVRRKDAEQKVGNIVIPTAAQEKSSLGEVLAVGPGRLLESGQRVPVSVYPGCVVMFGKRDGEEIEVNGETLVLLREDDIQGTVF